MSRPLLAYYGDDFTGSADVMEVLQWSGLRTVLFLQPPTKEQLLQFDPLCAFGIAGWGRTMSPEEMETHLLPAFRLMRASGAQIVHYKTCSTFDSSPQVGSIGKSLELGRDVFGPKIIPVVIGAPNLGRYQVFGNLFARSGLDTEPFRLDHHPTMSQHPITPMRESDLRKHLAAQTDLKIGLFDVLRLADLASAECNFEADADAILFDVLYPEHLATIGKVIEQMVEEGSCQFVVGSSGVEYALAAHWARNGTLESMQTHAPAMPTFSATSQLLAITGSCSPVNDRQIAEAVRSGFEEIAIDTARLAATATFPHEIESVVDKTLQLLQSGANVIVHSSRGPDDRRVHATRQAFEREGLGDLDIKLYSGRILGPRLGQILQRLLEQYPLKRVGVAGGDSSGYIARTLGLTALEAIAPVAPGSPLCRAYAESDLNGVEFFFKGGQVGKDDVWSTILQGTERVGPFSDTFSAHETFHNRSINRRS